MASGYYLLDHPNPYYPQTRPRSEWGWKGPTGLVTVHVAVSAMDAIAPDTGAENCAGFIATRKDAGGYHVLVDSDSIVNMAPDEYMTWHTAAFNLNGPGWGISAACTPDDWNPQDSWTQRTIALIGRSIREFWQRHGHDIDKVCRWLTLEEAAKGTIPGLVHHGVVQPGDRFDAWVKLSNGKSHPYRDSLDKMLIEAIKGEEDVALTKDEMTTIARWSAEQTVLLLQDENNEFSKALRDKLAKDARYAVNGKGRQEQPAKFDDGYDDFASVREDINKIKAALNIE